MTEVEHPPDGSDVPDDAHPAAYPPTPGEDDPRLPPSTDAGSTGALARLLRQTYFLNLYGAFSREHRGLHYFCFAIDFLIRLVVVSLLVAIIAVVAWKTLAPLPPLTQ